MNRAIMALMAVTSATRLRFIDDTDNLVESSADNVNLDNRDSIIENAFIANLVNP